MTFRPCALVTGALLSIVSGIAPASACVTVTAVVEGISHEVPGANSVVIDGPIADRIGAGISSATGDVVPAGGSYVLTDLPDGVLTYVVRIASGCATHHGRFPRRLVASWIEGQVAENSDHD